MMLASNLPSKTTTASSRPARSLPGRRSGVVAAPRANTRPSMPMSTTMMFSTSTLMLSSNNSSLRFQKLALPSRSRCARSSTARRASRGSDSSSNASVTARWSLDARFGSKAEAAALLVEWAMRIAPRALDDPETSVVRVLSGAVGASESRLEVEVAGLSSVSSLELLWSRLATLEENRAWQERLARHVVDGSTKWEVFYELGVGSRGGGGRGGAVSSSASTSTSSPPPPPPSPSQLVVVSGDEAKEILQADAATARAAVEKSNSNGNNKAGATGGEEIIQRHHGRGRPRSLERAAAARARAEAAAAAQKDQPASSTSSSPAPPPQLPPIKISSIIGNSSNINNNNGDDNDDVDTSKLVPGQRLPDGSVVATDWKGDVMIIRPGDRGISGL